jgi:hypothetical protein
MKTARSAATPTYAYALAVVAGLVLTPSMYWLGEMLGAVREPDASIMMWPLFWGAFAVAHAALGVVFGLVWPERTWRWGVWLSAAPLCLVSFFSPGAAFYAGWVMVSLFPSSSCAYAAGMYGLKSTKVI